VSPRARVWLVVAVAALGAVGAVVGVTLEQTRGGTPSNGAVGAPRKGVPRLLLDLGVRTDAEARALRRAGSLYDRGRHEAALEIFERYDSLQARIGAAFARWPDHSLEQVRELAAGSPASSLAQLHLGMAFLWAGRNADAVEALRRAERVQPDTASAVEADTVLHLKLAPGLPPFVPSFPFPARLRGLAPPAQLAALERGARAPDPRAKLLYGAALQRLGRRVSAEREFAAAARLAPNDPDARVAAAVGAFDKDAPQKAFSRLGPLVRVFPRAQTVRFHLGVLLLWLGDVKTARHELLLARAQSPASLLGREANAFLGSLVRIGTK
jgi:Flp pilus assembly protein TadD